MEKEKDKIRIGYDAKRIYHNKTGLGNYSRDLIRIMNQHYNIYKFYLYNPKQKNNINFLDDCSSVIEKNPQNRFFKYFYNLWRQFFIVYDLKKDKIELFHGLSGEIPFRLQQNNIKSVVTIHDLIFLEFSEFYNWFDQKIHFYKFKNAIQKSNHIIAISEQTKKDIIKYFKTDVSKISVLYQGCNTAFKELYNDADKQSVLKKYDLPEKFLLNVGTVEPRKNIFNAVKAIKNTTIPLIIIGKQTKYSQEIQNYLEANKMTNQVIFLKGLTQKELAIVYQLAKIFIYPSLYEGFGIPIIEALYSKTPVLTSNRSCLPEAAGPHSVYFDPENCEDIRTKILDTWEDQSKREEMIKNGYTFVQKFNDENIADNLNNLYTKILNL